MNLNDLYEMRDRRDAYQRDYDHSVSGMSKRDSYAYSQDGGGNDESHELDPTEWYIVKDGKMFKATVYPNQVQSAMSQGYSPSREEAKAKAEQGVAEAGFPGAPDVEMPPMKPSGDPQRDKLKQEYMDIHHEIKSLVDIPYSSDSSPKQKMQAKARIKQLNDRADQIKAILEPRQPPNEWQKKTYGYDDNWNIVKKGVAEGINESDDYSAVTSAITRRIITQHPEVVAKYGPAIVGQAIDEIAEFVGDVDEIGSSDVSGWVSQVIRSLGRFAPVRDEGVDEGSLNEFLDPQAVAQDPGLEREPTADVIFFGRMPQDFTANLVEEALEAVLPNEYPPGKAHTNNSNVFRVVSEIAKRQGAVVTTKPLSVAQKLAKTFQTYGIKCKVDPKPGLEEDIPTQDSGEYDYEGDQARDQMNTIVRAARRLDGLLDDNENMPEWVQMKVTLAADYLDTAADYIESNQEPELDEDIGQQLNIQQLATISDAALDKAYGYGRSQPGNSFGWQANLKSAAFAKQMIDKGVTDIDAISDAIHKGWNTTAQAFVQNPEQFDDTAKLKAAGKLEAKLQQRAQLMKQNYGQLPEEEKEKDRVVARALLQALKGEQGVAEVAPVRIGSKLPQSDTETFGLEPGRGYKINNPKDWKHGDRPRAVQQLIPTQDKKDHIRSRLGKHASPVLPEQGVAEGEKVGNMDADKFDDALARMKKLAGAGPMKTVWDPAKRVYRNVPVAVQPKK